MRKSGYDDARAPGTLLAQKYRIERVLGAGGMGVILAARHVQLEERVAIKLLHPEAARRSSAIHRFLREARIVMKLRSEHVVRIHDLGTRGDGVPFIVMEYLEGSDLGSLLRNRGPMEIAEAVDFVLQACEGVAEAHSIGVVHRDLKPPNLFVTTRVDRTPCVKVLDFGISKVLRDGRAGESVVLDETAPPSSHTLTPYEPESEPADTVRTTEGPSNATATHAVMGSPRYMAPEQIRCARDVDARADIWSLGVILYELVSGVLPFDADDVELLRRAILERRPRPLRTLLDAPALLEDAIETCLAKDPSDRFQSVHAFSEAIAPFASDDGRRSVERIARTRGAHCVAAPASSADPPVWDGAKTEIDPVTDEQPRRRRAYASASLVVVAPASVVLFVLFLGWARASRSSSNSNAPIPLASAAESGEAERPNESPKASARAAVLAASTAPPAPATPAPATPAPATRRRSVHPAASASRVLAPAEPHQRISIADPLGLDGGFLFDEPH